MYGVAGPGPKLIRREALPRPSQALPREALPRSYLACTSDPSGALPRAWEALGRAPEGSDVHAK